MLDGNFTQNVLTFPTVRPYIPHPQETSGVGDGSQAIYRYSLKDSDYPILSIVDKITDPDGNTIPAGHYELALSDEWDFLILMQTKNPVAIIPVFKVEEDKEAYKDVVFGAGSGGRRSYVSSEVAVFQLDEFRV